MMRFPSTFLPFHPPPSDFRGAHHNFREEKRAEKTFFFLPGNKEQEWKTRWKRYVVVLVYTLVRTRPGMEQEKSHRVILGILELKAILSKVVGSDLTKNRFLLHFSFLLSHHIIVYGGVVGGCSVAASTTKKM